MMIRKATVGDVKHIHRLLNQWSEQGKLLARSLSELYDGVRDYYVWAPTESGSGGEIAGACALHVCWEDLAEIRSLAVRPDSLRRGIGGGLVVACLEEARALGLKRVFALTYEPDWFSRFGFERVEKESLPNKIWGDCIRCPKYPDCDEIAVSINL
jgi:amino-acid N-acetyltransferase